MAVPSAVSFSERAVWALELYNGAMAKRTEEALDAYLGCFHREMEFTASASGMTLAASGVGELRAAIQNLFAAGLSHECRDIQVVSEEQNSVVTNCTRVVSQDGMPLTEAEAETDFAFKGELIFRMAVGERGRPADTPATWAPLGSTPSFAGEIVAHWAEEKLLVRLRDGREVELPSPAEAEGQWEVGDPVLVYFDGKAPLGWYLPDRQFGVDFRVSGNA